MTSSPVLEMLGLDLGHLPAGEVKHLLAEQLEDDHVVLAEALAGAAGPHDVADEGGPVFGPLLFQYLGTGEKWDAYAQITMLERYVYKHTYCTCAGLCPDQTGFTSGLSSEMRL